MFNAFNFRFLVLPSLIKLICSFPLKGTYYAFPVGNKYEELKWVFSQRMNWEHFTEAQYKINKDYFDLLLMQSGSCGVRE